MAAATLIDHYARTFLASAERAGFDPAAVAEGREPVAGRYDGAALSTISRNAKLMMQDELCGLTAHPLRMGAFQLMCEIGALSETVGDALDRAFRFYAAATPDLRFTLTQEDEHDAVLTVAIPDTGHDPLRVLPGWWLIFWQRFAQWLMGEKFAVIAAEFPGEPAVPMPEYLEVMGCDCRFGAEVATLRLPRTVLARRVVRVPADIPRFLAHRPVDMLTVDDVGDGIVTAIRARMRAHLESHQALPKLETLAEGFGMCGQTLRRRLEGEGSSYRALKADVRREVALLCLHDHNIPISQIATRAGFAEANGLARAIRAWAGVSPTAYRRMVLDRAGPSATP
ncbi:transcriptional regulator, AraC family [Sphingomonas laterariae]|uniref:Transcriptional regulator, AraC family n=1 Tax=Edaphosphingomonas laterariae TaxID=861865 RepID=A0A239GAF7_9SPHN|nr:AraC family transcriptional regulator [Sphingomonas laterariae]SNS66061.1 transcriptional regulator, AraC family [Sphingomonas laterariae]